MPTAGTERKLGRYRRRKSGGLNMFKSRSALLVSACPPKTPCQRIQTCSTALLAMSDGLLPLHCPHLFGRLQMDSAHQVALSIAPAACRARTAVVCRDRMPKLSHRCHQALGNQGLAAAPPSATAIDSTTYR